MTTDIYKGAGQAGNWTDPNNWAGGVPNTLDTALVNGGPNQTVTSSMAIGNLMAIGGETLTVTGAITSHGNGPCTGGMVCIGSTLDFAPGSTLNDQAKLIVGVSGIGTFIATGTISQHTTINALDVTLGLQAGGSGTMTVDGATVNTGCIWDEAAYNFSLCLENGLGIDRNEIRALKYLCQAADELPKARFLYGRRLANGTGTALDLEAGLDWVRRAAESGLLEARLELAEMLVNGRGRPRDSQAAKEIFLAAANNGHAGAMFALGAMFAGGHGVVPDRGLSQAWLRKAADRGHAHAQQALGHSRRGSSRSSVKQEAALV